MSEQVNANIYMVSWVITNQRDKCCSQRCLTQPDTSATFLSEPSSLLFLSELHKPQTKKHTAQSYDYLCWNHLVFLLFFCFEFTVFKGEQQSSHSKHYRSPVNPVCRLCFLAACRDGAQIIRNGFNSRSSLCKSVSTSLYLYLWLSHSLQQSPNVVAQWSLA